MAISPSERQQLLADLSTVATRDLVELWRRAVTADVDFARFLIESFPEIATTYANVAADLAADWYEQSAPALAYQAVSAPAPDVAALTKSAQWAMGADGDMALNRLSGTLQRSVFNGARDTTILNTTLEPGARWARHASANACEFCRMLATRGAVYRTEKDAVRVSGRSVDLSVADRRMRAAGTATTDELLARRMGQTTYVRGKRKGQAKVRRVRGERELGDKFHDFCHCTAVEVRPGMGYDPPDYVAQWEQDYYAAVEDAQKAGRTKGEYGAIDVKAVLASWRQLNK